MNAQQDEQALWDVALEALLLEQHKQLGEALDLAALTRLAEAHNIRLDDILDTLCKLVTHGSWEFVDRSGAVTEPDGDMCKLLKANHRLNDLQIERLRGHWRPAA